MFIKPVEWLSRVDLLSRPWVGIVKDNNDPRKLGRLKVGIPGLLEGISTSYLPWVYPMNSYGLGGKPDCSSFVVPEVDSQVVVIFPYKDIYFGFYIGYYQSNQTHQTLFDEDYPNTYGWRDSKNNYWKVNKTQEYIELKHSSGTSIRIEADGTIKVTSVKDIKFDIANDFNVLTTTATWNQR